MRDLPRNSDPLEPLLAKLVDGELTVSEAEQMEALLDGNADLLREYAENMHAHALLFHWSAAHASTASAPNSTDGFAATSGADAACLLPSTGQGSTSHGRKHVSYFRLAIAVSVLLTALASTVYWITHRPGTSDLIATSDGLTAGQAPGEASSGAPEGSLSLAGPKYIASITQQWRPVWDASGAPALNWSRIEVGRQLKLKSGRVSCLFDVGAEVILQGPARLQVLGANLVRLDYGDIDVRVSDSGKGFTVVSANGKVIDLGTEFGVSVQADGAMDVVVFDGEVELQRTSTTEGLAQKTEVLLDPLRLVMGQAIRLAPNGESSRIAHVNYDQFPRSSDFFTRRKDTAPVIESISDNMRSVRYGPYYQICTGGLMEDSRAYVDRVYEWNGVDDSGIPEELLGADYVLMFNDDKRLPDYEITIGLAQPAHLYVFWDQRYAPPGWLESRFDRTDYKIAMDTNASELVMGVGPGVEVDDLFAVWRLRVADPSKPVKLGPLWVDFGEELPPRKMGVSMYGIAAVALHE